jgi:glycosidase
MGFTAIWITPITEQISETTTEGTGFHGYWQKNMSVISIILTMDADPKHQKIDIMSIPIWGQLTT